MPRAASGLVRTPFTGMGLPQQSVMCRMILKERVAQYAGVNAVGRVSPASAAVAASCASKAVKACFQEACVPSNEAMLGFHGMNRMSRSMALFSGSSSMEGIDGPMSSGMFQALDVKTC